MRLMTSEPVPLLQTMGTRPARMTATVIAERMLSLKGSIAADAELDPDPDHATRVDGGHKVVAEVFVRAAITATTITSNLASPWGLAFLPDARMLVTLKGGSLVIVSANGQSVTPVTGVPAVNSSGQGGLLDVAIDPDFATTPWVYLSYAESGTGGSGTAVARAQLVGTALQGLQVIFRQSPKVGGDGHFGSRLVFSATTGRGHSVTISNEPARASRPSPPTRRCAPRGAP